MFLRVLLKTIFPAFLMGVMLTLLSDQAFAHCEFGDGDGGGGGGGGGSVPEIGAGSAAAALALLAGGAFILKDHFFGTRNAKTTE